MHSYNTVDRKLMLMWQQKDAKLTHIVYLYIIANYITDAHKKHIKNSEFFIILIKLFLQKHIHYFQNTTDPIQGYTYK